MNPAQPFKDFCVTFLVSRELRARIDARNEEQAEAIAEYLWRKHGDRHFNAGPEEIFDTQCVEWEARS